MKYINLSNGNVVLGTIMPISEWIDKDANRKFVDEGHILVDSTIADEDLLLTKYDPSAEEQDEKTKDSFISAGVDAKGNERWFDLENGKHMEYTYNSDNQIDGEQEVS